METLTASLAAAEEQANASADELKKANTTIASLQASAASSEQATNQQLALLQSQLTDTAAKLQRETAKHTEEIAAFKWV